MQKNINLITKQLYVGRQINVRSQQRRIVKPDMFAMKKFGITIPRTLTLQILRSISKQFKTVSIAFIKMFFDKYYGIYLNKNINFSYSIPMKK